MRSLLYLCLLPALAGAAESRTLPETEFLSGLDHDHPAVLELELVLDQAQAKAKSASLWANPDLQWEREAWGEADQQSSLVFSWQPPLLGGKSAERKAAQAGIEEAKHRFNTRRAELRSRAREAYAEWWLATERLQVLRAHSGLVTTLVEGVRSRAAAGEESGLTARRFELERLQVQVELAQAEVQWFAASARIRVWLGAEGLQMQPAKPVLPGPEEPLSWEAQPRVLGLRAAAQRAEYERRAAGGFLQFPSLEFGWLWQDGDPGGVDAPVAGLSWSVPLFDRNQAQKMRAEGELRSTRAELEFVSREAQAVLDAAQRTYQILYQAALAVEESTPELDVLADAAMASFRSGERTDTDLLEILRSVLEARIRALEIHAGALRSHRDLELAAGRPLTVGGSR